MLVSGTAIAETSSPEFFDTRAQFGYGDARVPLTVYLAAHKRRVPLRNHFCVIGYRGEGRYAWVHWLEGQRMILWEGRMSDDLRRKAILQSRRDLDLRKDVVASDADIGGSNYLVTREWVRQTLADCNAHGVRVIIRRPKG